MNENIKANTEKYNEEYLCNKCGLKVMLDSTSSVVCKTCGSRIFRKLPTEKIIRIRGR